MSLNQPPIDPEELDDVENDDEDDLPPTITQRIIAWIWFFFKLGFVMVVLTIIVGAGLLFGVIKGFSEQVPNINEQTYRPNLTTKVFDVKGRLLAQLHAEENRTRILPAAEVPQNMRHAIVAIEDERFYQHYGIDLEGIGRAAWRNFQAGRVVEGGSTLTQQLIKNAFLTNEKSLKRKVKEAMLAFQLERKFSKDEILTYYLNEIYFGHGAYGLDAAAKLYFNKEARELTLAECATLAGIPKSPVAFSPYKNPENNRSRKMLVLAKMQELGFISPSEAEAARSEKVPLNPIKDVTEAPVNKFAAPYFVTYVRDQLLEKYGANLVYNGGLKVHTTLDLDLQKLADQAFQNADIIKSRPIEKDPEMNGALVSINPRNGHILAMVGGRSFEASQFNRVTQAYRQPGSSFKPFVYGCAIESGMLPGDMILDEPISFVNPWSHKVWAPKNYDLKFHGSITLRKAIHNSYNVPAVKLIDKLTPQRVVRFTRKLGVTSKIEPNLSMALGSACITPLEMASAYGVFANQGIYVTPLSILKVEDRDGNILDEYVPQAREVMKAAYAAVITDMLQGAVEMGTGKGARLPGRAVAGKTGTTNDYVDAWFNGYTPEMVTVVQFGYDHVRTLGHGKAGGVVCCPVWRSYMEKAVASYPPSQFPVPEGAVRVRMCLASGKLAVNGCPTAVNQCFPRECVPTQTCYHGGGGGGGGGDDDGVEVASNNSAAVAAMQADNDFFRTDYAQAGNGAGAPAAGPSVKINAGDFDDAVIYGGRAPGTTPRSANPESDGVSPGAPRSREPGVVMQPKVDFREGFD